jgi:uracil-DNA glycosylase
MDQLLKKIRQCELCKEHLPLDPKPIVQLNPSSKIIIIGQAPGLSAHQSGIPWNDRSGKRLLEWMNIDRETFYDSSKFSIMPIGFCYPGRGSSGDRLPRPECAGTWHSKILNKLNRTELILLIGHLAQRSYLKTRFENTLTETVRNYKNYLPSYFPLPHPSPRNQNWVKINPWFTREVLPDLQEKISKIIGR